MMEQIAQDRGLPEVVCVREVRLPVAADRFADVLHFYVELLGFQPWDADDQIPGGFGVGHPQRGLYLQYRHDPPVDPMRRRLTLLVESLEELVERLREAEWPYAQHQGLDLTDRWLDVHDPNGHLLHVRQSWTNI